MGLCVERHPEIALQNALSYSDRPATFLCSLQPRFLNLRVKIPFLFLTKFSDKKKISGRLKFQVREVGSCGVAAVPCRDATMRDDVIVCRSALAATWKWNCWNKLGVVALTE